MNECPKRQYANEVLLPAFYKATPRIKECMHNGWILNPIIELCRFHDRMNCNNPDSKICCPPDGGIYIASEHDY
jgi:hypothetical protein